MLSHAQGPLRMGCFPTELPCVGTLVHVGCESVCVCVRVHICVSLCLSASVCVFGCELQAPRDALLPLCEPEPRASTFGGFSLDFTPCMSSPSSNILFLLLLHLFISDFLQENAVLMAVCPSLRLTWVAKPHLLHCRARGQLQLPDAVP